MSEWPINTHLNTAHSCQVESSRLRSLRRFAVRPPSSFESPSLTYTLIPPPSSHLLLYFYPVISSTTLISSPSSSHSSPFAPSSSLAHSLYHTTPHSSLLTGKHSYHAVDHGNVPDSEFISNDGPMHSSWRSMISFGRVRKREDRLEIAAILVFNHIYSNIFRWSDPGRLPLGLLQKWETAGSGRPCRWRALAALRTVCQMAGVPSSVKIFFWKSETYIETRSACHYTRPRRAVS